MAFRSAISSGARCVGPADLSLLASFYDPVRLPSWPPPERDVEADFLPIELLAPAATGATMAVGLLVLHGAPTSSISNGTSIARVTAGSMQRAVATPRRSVLPRVMRQAWHSERRSPRARTGITSDSRGGSTSRGRRSSPHVGLDARLGSRHPAFAVPRLRRFRRDRFSGPHHLRRHAAVANLPVLCRAEPRKAIDVGLIAASKAGHPARWVARQCGRCLTPSLLEGAPERIVAKIGNPGLSGTARSGDVPPADAGPAGELAAELQERTAAAGR